MLLFDYRCYQVYLACGKTDLRKSINGLSEIVLNQFQMDPTQPVLFAFCNKSKNRLKLLVWEDNGFWVHLKRLEKGSLSWPEPLEQEQTMALTLEDFKNLIQAPGIHQKIKRQAVWQKS